MIKGPLLCEFTLGEQKLFQLLSLFVSQVLLGWKYGDCVDEKGKTHPQLRTYKALTEKVTNNSVTQTNKHSCLIVGTLFLMSLLLL